MVQSWDVAVTLDGDYSVSTTWVMIGKDVYLTDVWRGRIEFPALKRKVAQLQQKHDVRTVLVEKAGLGLTLWQDLRRELHTADIIGLDPKGDKAARLEGESPAIEAGHVYLPEDAPWLADYMSELLAFPNGRYDDQVDSTTQFLRWRRERQVTVGTKSTLSFGPMIITADGPLHGPHS